MRKLIIILLYFGVFSTAYAGYQGNVTNSSANPSNKYTISEMMKKKLKFISEHKIMFAHHSVGKNIMDGVREISKLANIELDIQSIQIQMPTQESSFVEFYPGENKLPRTKVESFVKKIESLENEYVPDLAFMKFCYIDFLKDTDVEEVFSYYKDNIEMLKSKTPNTSYAHLTAPLMSRSNSLKSKIKRLLGIEDWVDVTNAKREKYNKLLRTYFSGEPIFDLAQIESTNPDGSRSTFTYNGTIYHQMSPDLTSDGGHLNVEGSRVIAEKMIEFIYDTIKRKLNNGG